MSSLASNESSISTSPSDSPAVLQLVSHTPSPTSSIHSITAEPNVKGNKATSATSSPGTTTSRSNSVTSRNGQSSSKLAIAPIAEEDWKDWYAGGNWLPTIAPPVPSSLQPFINQNDDNFPSSPEIDLDDPDFDDPQPSPFLSDPGPNDNFGRSPPSSSSLRINTPDFPPPNTPTASASSLDSTTSSSHSSGRGNLRSSSSAVAVLTPPATNGGERSTTPISFSSGGSRTGSIPSLDSFKISSDENGTLDVLEIFKQKGYLPGPKGRYEEERLKILRRYDLDSPVRRAAIDRICKIAKAHFKTNTIIVTLVFDGHTVLAAEAGFDPNGDPGLDEPVRELPLETSLCAHTVTRVKDKSVMIVPDVSKDWRFRHNPQSIAVGGGLGFYAGASIHLPTYSELSDAPSTLPVGSICVLDREPKSGDFFGPDDQEMLQNLSSLIAEQFSLGYERLRRDREQKQTEFLGSFLERTLVHSLHPVERELAETALSAAPTTIASRPFNETRESTSLKHSFGIAAGEMLELTGATSAAILDLRGFQLPILSKDGPQVGGSIDEETDDETSSAYGNILLLASEGAINWNEIIEKEAILARAVAKAMNNWCTAKKSDYILPERSPFDSLLPDNVTATSIVPVFEVDGVVSLLLVLNSSTKHFVFEKVDRKFASNIGSVLCSALLRERALMADRAKLAFVSQVSHELRTPLFAVASQLELMREFSTPEELTKISPMLDVADVCLESLRDVLDDTLDVAKFSNSTPGMTAHQRAALAKVDLSKLAAEVAQACFIRKRRTDLVTNDDQEMAMGRRPSVDSTAVDLVLEVEERPAGWNVWVDVGGLKRVLLNLLGNALKFTEAGYVKITLREAILNLNNLAASPGPFGPTPTTAVILEVEDTGCGISDEFIRSGQLFTPFVQENSFKQGAGLGMSICETIVKRMGGKIDVVSAVGEGTTFRITLPLEFGSPAATPDSPTTPRAYRAPETPHTNRFTTNPFAPQTRQRAASNKSSPPPAPSSRFAHGANVFKPLRRRVISDELLSLFNPGSKLAAPQNESGPTHDFSAAVDAAQIALGAPPLQRVPSYRKNRTSASALTEDKATTFDMVDEVARLSFAGVVSPPIRPVTTPPARIDPNFVFGRSPSNRSNPVISPVPEVEPLDITPSAQAAEARPRLKVLFADDSGISRKILAKLLSGKGIDYVGAVDGDDAVTKFVEGSRQGRFHLLLMDVQMPNKDGIEASFEIRRIEKEKGLPASRIIALSGLSNEADMSKAGVLTNSGPMDSWIVKGSKSLRQVTAEIMAQRAMVEEGIELPTSSPTSASPTGGGATSTTSLGS